MTNKTVPTYFPTLEAASKVLDKKHKLLKYMIGTKGCTRVGEQYLCTCVCTAHIVTSDAAEADKFIAEHEECEK